MKTQHWFKHKFRTRGRSLKSRWPVPTPMGAGAWGRCQGHHHPQKRPSTPPPTMSPHTKTFSNSRKPSWTATWTRIFKKETRKGIYTQPHSPCPCSLITGLGLLTGNSVISLISKKYFQVLGSSLRHWHTHAPPCSLPALCLAMCSPVLLCPSQVLKGSLRKEAPSSSSAAHYESVTQSCTNTTISSWPPLHLSAWLTHPFSQGPWLRHDLPPSEGSGKQDVQTGKAQERNCLHYFRAWQQSGVGLTHFQINSRAANFRKLHIHMILGIE